MMEAKSGQQNEYEQVREDLRRLQEDMAKLIAATPDNGVSLHRWNVWESIANCPPKRHGNGRGCQTCPLGPACLAKAQERRPTAKIGIASRCNGFYARIACPG